MRGPLLTPITPLPGAFFHAYPQRFKPIRVPMDVSDNVYVHSFAFDKF